MSNSSLYLDRLTTHKNYNSISVLGYSSRKQS